MREMYENKTRTFAKPIPDNPDALFRSVDDVAKRLKPEGPVQCIFPEPIRTQAQKFLTQFQGQVLYAVKCNPGEDFLRHMHSAGIRQFDVASLDEEGRIREVLGFLDRVPA